MPEIALKEKNTAQEILNFFSALQPDQTITQTRWRGLSFLFSKGKSPESGLYSACELGCVFPIEIWKKWTTKARFPRQRAISVPRWHYAIICGLVRKKLAQTDLNRARSFTFQPAEETGDAQKQIFADPRCAEIRPDYAFALHNLPGYPLHANRDAQGEPFLQAVRMSISLKAKRHIRPIRGRNQPCSGFCQGLIQKSFAELPKESRGFPCWTLIMRFDLAFWDKRRKGSLQYDLESLWPAGLMKWLKKVERSCH